MIENKKIPIIIIAGFLGSGKTTLINHLLSEAIGTKIGIIINDFGQINIDSMLVTAKTEEKIELASGCICCMANENSLDEPVDKLVKGSPDVIIVEASGLAEPREIVHKALSLKNGKVDFGGLIYVVDAVNFKKLFSAQQSQINSCIKVADLILINKTDLTSEANLKSVEKICKDINKKVLVVKTSNGKIDPGLLFDKKTQKNNQLSLADKHEDHIHDGFTSISFSTNKPIDPRKFIDFINNLDTNVYRVKGVIYFGMKGYEQKYIFQKVGDYKNIHQSTWEDEAPKTNLVAIGSGFSKEHLNRQLKDLIDKRPDDLSEENMIKVKSEES